MVESARSARSFGEYIKVCFLIGCTFRTPTLVLVEAHRGHKLNSIGQVPGAAVVQTKCSYRTKTGRRGELEKDIPVVIH